MPKYLPRPDLPPLIYEALVEQEYQDSLRKYFDSLPPKSRKLKKYSVTTLSRSPRERILSERHDHEVTVDPVEDRFWSLDGQTTHLLLERRGRPEDLVEVRLGVDVGPFPDGSYIHLHGQADNLYTSEHKLEDDEGNLLAYVPAHSLTDYKKTSAWSLVKGEKMAFHAQLNCNTWIVRQHGYTVEHLKNYFLFKDWRFSDARRIPNYPSSKLIAVDVPMWDTEKTVDYFMGRLWAHASVEHLPDDELPYCTREEKWQTGLPEFKVYKLKDDGERQRNSKFTSTSKLEAQEWMEETLDAEWSKIKEDNASKKEKNRKPESELVKPAYEIKELPPAPTRCHYCSAAPFCNQRKEELLQHPHFRNKEDEQE